MSKRLRGLYVLLFFMCGVATAKPVLAEGTPPEAFSRRKPLTDFDLERKKEGRYVVGLPLANFDPSTGVGYGARGYVYWNGSKDDSLFNYLPYRHRVFLQFFRTTKGLTFHWLDYDGPAYGNGRFRLRGQFIYVRNTQQHYFGLGNQANGDLSVTGLGTFTDFSKMDEALNGIDASGTTRSRYNHYDIRRPIGLVGGEMLLFGGLLKAMAGVGAMHNGIQDYTGRQVEARPGGKATQAAMSSTRLNEDCQAGIIVGCDGGWDNFIRLGLMVDTRDYEPDPNSGIFADAALDLGTKALGSDYQYARFLLSARAFVSPMPKIADLVIASRATLLMHSKGAPFFTQTLFPFTEDPRTGMGGHRTLRGFKQDRFVGRAAGLLNTELRWTVGYTSFWKQEFGLLLIPFLDVGRVFDDIGEFTLDDWRVGWGGAVRIAWNQATLISVDYGTSKEDSGLYINFAHMF